jgi:hypothetical protein
MLQNPKLTLPPRKKLLRDAAEVETFSSAAFDHLRTGQLHN